MLKQFVVSAGALAFLGMTAPALAQTPGAAPSMPAHSEPMAQSLPEQCRTATAGMPQGQATADTQGTSMQGMSDAQKAYMEAMMKMHGPMMTGTQAKDPDVAFVCGMIPHHQGAIDMARAELKYGDNPEARHMADRIIQDQSREIEEMTAWLKKNAKK